MKTEIAKKIADTHQSQNLNDWRIDEIKNFSIQIVDGDRGTNYPKNHELNPTGFCVFLNNKNIKNDKFDFSESDFITEEKDKVLRKGKLLPNDIILTTRGSVGNVAFYSGKPYQNVRINSGMVIIRNYQDDFEPAFLYGLLKSLFLKNQYREYSTGSAQPQLPIRDLQRIKLIKPPIDEQKVIGEIISSIDEKIDLNNEIIKNLSSLGHTLVREWFIEKNNPMISHEQEWITVKLGDLITRNNKKIKNKIDWDNKQVIDLSVMPNFSLVLDKYSPGKNFTTNIFELNEYDIVFGSIRPYFGKAGFSPINGVITGTVFSFLPKDKNFYSLILFLITSRVFIDFTVQHSRGTKMPIIGWDDFCDFELEIPNGSDAVKKFNDLMFPVIESINQKIKEIIQLQSALDSLLPRLISRHVKN